MDWNLEERELIKLLDDKVMSITTDQDCVRGFCETCDFGSKYIQTITIMFEDGDRISYEIENDYQYALDEARLMQFFANNLENFAQMTRDDFCAFLERLEEHNRYDEEICEIYKSLEAQ